MIKQIIIDDVPPYLCGKQVIEAKHVNFLFGLNGSGKTTISRFLQRQDDSRFNGCSIDWNGSPIKCEVYNRDYVDENFGEDCVPGIFTLGKENIEVKRKIEEISNELKQLVEQKGELTCNLEGLDGSHGFRGEVKELEDDYIDKFWNVKQRFDHENSSLNLALVGVRHSKALFKSRLLEEKKSNRSELIEKSDLEKQCSQLFDAKVEKTNKFPIPSFDELIAIESNNILQRVVVGKKDVDISGLIRNLGSEGWFRQGVMYLDYSNGVCPFCQRPLEEDFINKVRDYFDESYHSAEVEISKLCDTYSSLSGEVLEELKFIVDNPSKFIKIAEFQTICQQLKFILSENGKKLLDKKKSPNITIQLDSIRELADTILLVLREANSSIDDYNRRIERINDEREILTSKVWRYIIESISCEIDAYLQEKNKLDTAIHNTGEELDRTNDLIKNKEFQLHSLEQSQSSVTPTANGINKLLKGYGVTGFSLETNESNKAYRLVRADGSLAMQSLSEGERNLVTFLYFIYALRGNRDESGRNDEKVVVIDDPVSSLDNDFLFLAGTLVRDLFGDIYAGKGSIKQLFVLSHNTYFYKEVSFGMDKYKSKTGYWIIAKSNNMSTIQEYAENPISSTYEMLWDEVRRASLNPVGSNTLTLSNTMRRILEYYFKFLGGISLNSFHLEFEDGERQIFRSFITWAHAGSHSAFDDYSAPPNSYSSETYLKMFKKLFEEANHIDHYNMMMRSATKKEKDE